MTVLSGNQDRNLAEQALVASYGREDMTSIMPGLGKISQHYGQAFNMAASVDMNATLDHDGPA